MPWPLTSVAAAARRARDRRWPLQHEHDPALDLFDRGCFALSRDGRPAGHVVTLLSAFRTPLQPRTEQDWIWVIAIWPDGTRTPPQENYAPFDRGDVGELLRGEWVWSGTTYDATLLPGDQAEQTWERLGVTESDF